MSQGPSLVLAIDPVADLRQCRLAAGPDPAEIAMTAAASGIAAISAHLHPDRRGVQETDVIALQEQLDVPLILSLSAGERPSLVASLEPEFLCLVPGVRREFTTEGGLDIVSLGDRLAATVERLLEGSAQLGAFVDPDEEQIAACARLGMSHVTLNAGTCAMCAQHDTRSRELRRIEHAARCAADSGLAVRAARNIDYDNVAEFAAIDRIDALVVGHALVARSITSGIGAAIRELQERIGMARSR